MSEHLMHEVAGLATRLEDLERRQSVVARTPDVSFQLQLDELRRDVAGLARGLRQALGMIECMALEDPQ